MWKRSAVQAVAPMLVLLYMMHYNKAEKYEKSRRLNALLEELKDAETKREA